QISIRTWHESARLFTPENYLLNTILEALQLVRQSRQPTQIRLPHNEFILLMPDVSLVYLTMDLYSESFTRLCEAPIQKGDARLHLPSTQEMTLLAEQVRRDARHTHDLEALIWTSSLITSHGRLNRNTDAGKPLYLRAWPNLTRLEQFPHALRIAAIWSRKPGNVFDVAQWLDIPQRYVFAFHTAANAVGLFVADQDKIQQRREKPVEQKNRGLFSRLLRRLLGGGRK
ncbi:MAG: hypothetical protein KDI15_06105, partial [Thiothrix sp.]|nr:hypothetical protein [Thiothrix sp.]